MANLLEYDIRVIGRRALESEFASIERRLAAHNQAVTRMTGTTAARPRSASTGSTVATEARAAAAAQRAELAARKQAAKEAAAAARASARAEVAAARDAAHEKKAIAREEQRHHDYWRRMRETHIRQQHQREVREANQRLTVARQEARARTAFVKSTLGNSAARVGSTLSAVGTIGLATVGIGGAALAAGAISQATKLDEGSRRLAIQGRNPGESGLNPDDLRRSFTRVGIARGIAPEQVMAGAAAYTAETGDVNAAMANLETFATVSHAHSAQPERSFRRDLSRRSGARERDRSEATRGLVSGRLGLRFQGFLLSDRRTAELEHVGVVDQAVADRVRDSRVTESLVPSFRRHLRGDHSRCLVVAILDHFEQIAPFGVRHRVEQEVVEDEHVDT